ncbi:MAG: DUF4876 domain-containing protein [Prevotella sp.]|nr:DUF4876 domain-containing protein [Prevotella sp.]
MKTKFLSMFMAATAMTFAFTSCSDDDNNEVASKMVSVPLSVDMPLTAQNAKLHNATAVLTNLQTSKQYTSTSFSFTNNQWVDTINVPEGTYSLDIKGKISYQLDDTTEVVSDVKSHKDNMNVVYNETGLAQAEKVALNTYSTKDGLVISEIFFTGTQTPEGKQYSSDQYIMIGNNADTTMYLDGLAIVESDFLSTTKQDYTPDIMEKAMTVDAVYVIPGNGTEHPLKPGEQVTIACNAKNHTEFNSNSFDLSNAAFEFHDTSSDPNNEDTDNPNVPNLESWTTFSATYFTMHNRGFKSMAIARIPISYQQYLTNYKYEYSYELKVRDMVFPMSSEAYRMPNDWIVDAVGLGVTEAHEWNVVSSTLDAGYAHCGKTTSDKSRYGKAVVRKKDATTGKWIDTNNSSDDFESEAVPFYLKK